MVKKKVTIETLSQMVSKGFGSVESKMATKKELGDLRVEMNERFDKIEKLILADHKRRIERLEFEVKELKNLLAV